MSASVDVRGEIEDRRARASGATRGKLRISPALQIFCVAALFVGLAAALHFYLARGSLWEDELIAITHANQPLPSFFVEVVRNDMHPPLYFLQLDAWNVLGSNSDAWALANSLLWALVSLGTMFFVARTLYGTRAALVAAALFSVLPTFIWSAGTLRMYAALPACVLLSYLANRRWFDTRRSGYLVLALVVEALTAYVHAIEFFFVAFIAFGALVEAQRRGVLRAPHPFGKSLGAWILMQLAVAICVLPLASSALIRGSDASAPSSVSAILSIGGALVAGWKTSGLPWVRGAGIVIFGVLIVASLAHRESRWRTIAIPIAAIVVATVVGLLFKPIFKQPVFAANLLPFVVLGAAAAAANKPTIMRGVVTCIAILGLAAFPLARLQAQSEGYADAAHSLVARAKPGDVVVVPNVSVYWGVMRYAVGPDWGRPLSIMPPANAEWSRLNDRIARLLGPSAPRDLDLIPQRNYVDAGGVRYVIGEDAIDATENARHVWLVTRERYSSHARIDPRFKPANGFVRESYGDGELTISRFDRPDAP